MLDKDTIDSFYDTFGKYVNRKDGHIIHAILWNGTEKMYQQSGLKTLSYADEYPKGTSTLQEVPTKDGEYCFRFFSGDAMDDSEYLPYMKDDTEQFVEANQGYIAVGTQWFDEGDPIVIPRKIFEHEFVSVLKAYKTTDFENAIRNAKNGYAISEPTLKGSIFEPKKMSCVDRNGKGHQVMPYLIMKDDNMDLYHAIDTDFLPRHSRDWYVID